MKEVPNMMSTKDLSYLEDMFNWHFIICKKAYGYSSLVSDEMIINFFNNVYKKHKMICDKIIKLLG